MAQPAPEPGAPLPPAESAPAVAPDPVTPPEAQQPAPEVTPTPSLEPHPANTPSPTVVPAGDDKKATPAATTFVIDGYMQPQYRLRQDSGVKDDTDGFRFARIRPMLRASTKLEDLEFAATFEFEVQPSFTLQDAYAGLSRKLEVDGKRDGKLVFDVGQMRTPISRAQMLSDSRLTFVDKAQIATIAPRRDLGARLTLVVPYLPRLKLIGGAFNGEGPNQVENIDQKKLYAARFEANVLGKEGSLAEGAFGGDYLTIAGSYGHNGIISGDREEAVTYLGADIAGAYKGFAATFEYLYIIHTLSSSIAGAMLPPDYNQNGWNAQLTYLLPIILPRETRLEVGARVEEIDRDDEVAIVAPGDSGQSVRIYTGVISYYLRKHSLKLALALQHFTELEDKTVNDDPADYDNDQAVLQLTYRME